MFENLMYTCEVSSSHFQAPVGSTALNIIVTAVLLFDEQNPSGTRSVCGLQQYQKHASAILKFMVSNAHIYAYKQWEGNFVLCDILKQKGIQALCT